MKSGLSMREAGARLQASHTERISLDNVHKCSTYVLRQELRKHGYFGDDYEGEVNHTILLKAMVRVLQMTESQKENEVTKAHNELSENLRDKLAKQKALRKIEAVERSRLRQADRNYFEERRRSNKIQVNSDNCEIKDKIEYKDPELTAPDKDDPFAPRFKSKIGGKYS